MSLHQALKSALMTALLCSTSMAHPSAGPASLLTEVNRELGLLRHSVYAHHTRVDEAEGRFDYDCSGFLDYALQRAAPAALAELPVSNSHAGRPLAQDFYRHFRTASSATGHWHRVRRPIDLQAGDVVAWLEPPQNDTNNTGHVMVVRARPSVNPSEANEVLIRVADSTTSPHALDSRSATETGLGTGTIGITTDPQGRPRAFRWRGDRSAREQITAIALARLN